MGPSTERSLSSDALLMSYILINDEERPSCQESQRTINQSKRLANEAAKKAARVCERERRQARIDACSFPRHRLCAVGHARASRGYRASGFDHELLERYRTCKVDLHTVILHRDIRHVQGMDISENSVP